MMNPLRPMGRCCGGSGSSTARHWVPLLFALAGTHSNAFSADPKVYPVPAVFWNADEKRSIDQDFLKPENVAKYRQQIKDSLTTQFAGMTGDLTTQSAGYTFAASFQITRMAAYEATKADGNLELHTPVTGSIYFTNILTGEIILTVTGTNVGVRLMSRSEREGPGYGEEVNHLYASTLAELIDQLSKKAAHDFKPRRIEAQVVGEQNGLLLLSAGFRQGFQEGTDLEDDQQNLIGIVYSAGDYAVARRKKADGVGVGTTFHRFVVGSIDGRLRPGAAVILEAPPDGFSAEYLTQQFSEALGDKAPLTVVQVNPTFANVLNTVVQAASLNADSLSKRESPQLIIRLRVGNPVYFEAKTNLAFKTLRMFETSAFADIVDTSGRVLYSAAGHDLQKIEVTGGFDMAVTAREEISVKNALLTLAEDLGKLAEGHVESASIARLNGGVFLATPGKVLERNSHGIFLHSTEFKISGKSRRVGFPIFDGKVVARSGAETEVATLLPSGDATQTPGVGDVFEIVQLGRAPKSETAFRICPNTENLGTVSTPNVDDIASVAVGRAMPGMYYTPEIAGPAGEMISERNGFQRSMAFDRVAPTLCLQVVQHGDVIGEDCPDLCQKAVMAHLTLRARNADAVVNKWGLERKSKTPGYAKDTPAPAVSSLVQSDLEDEAWVLFSSIANQVDLSTSH